MKKAAVVYFFDKNVDSKSITEVFTKNKVSVKPEAADGAGVLLVDKEMSSDCSKYIGYAALRKIKPTGSAAVDVVINAEVERLEKIRKIISLKNYDKEYENFNKKLTILKGNFAAAVHESSSKGTASLDVVSRYSDLVNQINAYIEGVHEDAKVMSAKKKLEDFILKYQSLYDSQFYTVSANAGQAGQRYNIDTNAIGSDVNKQSVEVNNNLDMAVIELKKTEGKRVLDSLTAFKSLVKALLDAQKEASIGFMYTEGDCTPKSQRIIEWSDLKLEDLIYAKNREMVIVNL